MCDARRYPPRKGAAEGGDEKVASIKVNEEKCKGCGLCVEVCPKKILALETGRLNRKGYSPMRCVEPEKCIGCAMCATVCPDVAIVVER